MGFSQEDESEKPEAAWENPVLVIVRGIKYNESYKMLTGGICMGSYLNPGNFSFRGSLRSKIYIDKSGLISKTNETICTEQKYICVSRPRRFGKSMAANMLAAYYDRSESTEELFKNLSISKDDSYKENLNQYDVIKINMQEFLSMTDTIEEMLEML